MKSEITYCNQYLLVCTNFISLACDRLISAASWTGGVYWYTEGITPPGEGVLPYISYIGMCRPKGYGFEPFWSENGYRF